MPEQGTQIAKEVDNLYGFLLVVSFISCAILIGGMIYFAIKYKRKSQSDKTPYITHDTRLEILWSVIPLIIFLVVFAWGWTIYHDMRAMPENALEIHVTGKQWAWTVEYKNGVKSTDLVVPVNKDIKIILASEDVIHSFYVPSFRIKQDAVPGRYTTLWFRAEKMGEFYAFCTEFCGTNHSGMVARVKVVTQEEFDKWLVDESEIGLLPLAQRGAKYFQTRACASCHNVDNAAVKVGPSLFKKFGTEGVFGDGSVSKFDENYVRQSILEPQAKIVKGFPKPSPMPSYQGQLSESELSALIEYIKGLK
ncbi:MAG: cytochrome c oxidase subunit II [Bdellovibrionales bacterium RIFCSPHIGHO2_01_FULL_40_29]|nr:MAG: cytochrome c oxidase subunit II [Bdellovibrionales bacterium RIFCSPHIGHO2_01_FULL_40_29]OFZ35427.1 MAG: cytochrome c oxidase subunit II [Bdellovibrionales bacterium RIFCSPHIGHO2_02_FULL_40_15]